MTPPLTFSFPGRGSVPIDSQRVEARHVDRRYAQAAVELRTPSYYALAALIDGPLHGYAMVRRAAELSDGTVRLSTGTLFTHFLDRAIDAGLVVAGDRVRRSWTYTARLCVDPEWSRSTRCGGPASPSCLASGDRPAESDVCAGRTMNRERVGAAVLRAYPSETRAARGPEMLGTLLDLGADSNVRFVREAVDLLRLGLRSRASRIAGSGARRLIADGACVAGIFFLAQDLATALHSRGVPHPFYSPASMAILAVALTFGLLGHDRVAGAVALVWFGLRLFGVMTGLDVAAYPATLLPVICCGAMMVSPRIGRSRSLPVRRLREPLAGRAGRAGRVGRRVGRPLRRRGAGGGDRVRDRRRRSADDRSPARDRRGAGRHECRDRASWLRPVCPDAAGPNWPPCRSC